MMDNPIMKHSKRSLSPARIALPSRQAILSLALLVHSATMIGSVSSFIVDGQSRQGLQQPPRKGASGSAQSSKSALHAAFGEQRLKLSSLPKDISPFEKSAAKRRDVQGDFRRIAETALNKALQDGMVQLEIEFPPLLGGGQSKTQFDDFDNVQELNMNRDWCVQLLPSLATSMKKKQTGDRIWLILPDLKEVELCRDEWKGQRYQQAATFTSIEAVAAHYGGAAGGGGSAKNKDEGYSKPWGATFAGAVNQLLGGASGDSGLLGNKEALDSLEDAPACLHLVCQPGNGGPVEDWINVKALHENAATTTGSLVPTCVVNGALDKVRDGYYAPFIFPKLAKTFDFYRRFEQVFFLKPISDKGVYGWLFRVYPEPWQVVLQQPVRNPKNDALVVEDTVALVSDTRPAYNECVQALLATAAARN